MSINKQIVVGRLGKDPEVRFTQNGTAVCNITIAVNERVKQNGEWQDHTEWFDAVVWGKDAENAGKYLTKGRWVYLEGPSRIRKWTDKQGQERQSREVEARLVKYLGGGDGAGSAPPAGNKPKDPNYVDDLPF